MGGYALFDFCDVLNIFKFFFSDSTFKTIRFNTFLTLKLIRKNTRPEGRKEGRPAGSAAGPADP